MPSSPRDRISVDLQGLGPTLELSATSLGVTPSELVRRVLVDALHGERAASASSSKPRPDHEQGHTPVRLTLRMLRRDVEATRSAARRAGLSCGAYVAGLVAAVPALTAGGTPNLYVSALTASNAEMAGLARDLRRLAALLQQGSSQLAQEHRDCLESVSAAVRKHIMQTSFALAALQPRCGCLWSLRTDSPSSSGEQS